MVGVLSYKAKVTVISDLAKNGLLIGVVLLYIYIYIYIYIGTI